MHRLLRRQLRKHLGVEGEVPAALQSFVAAVDSAYTDFDSCFQSDSGRRLAKRAA